MVRVRVSKMDVGEQILRKLISLSKSQMLFCIFNPLIRNQGVIRNFNNVIFIGLQHKIKKGLSFY